MPFRTVYVFLPHFVRQFKYHLEFLTLLVIKAIQTSIVIHNSNTKRDINFNEDRVFLKEFINSNMSAKDYKNAFENLLLTKNSFDIADFIVKDQETLFSKHTIESCNCCFERNCYRVQDS